VIRVIMLDLGDTLTDGQRLFPHVPDCLEALAGFVAPDGKTVELCLVSDFKLADPFTEAEVAARFDEYLEVLDRLGLRPHFEPVERRVTLSTHANVFKPDRRVFTTALDRLGGEQDLANCLFITENREHIAACRSHGMTAVPFGDDAGREGGFDSWPEGLFVIAKTIAPDRVENLEIALRVWAGARHGIENLRVAEAGQGDVISVTAQRWLPLEDPELGPLDGINVRMPVTLNLQATSGAPEVVEAGHPSEDELKEAKLFVKSLSEHHQIARDPSEDAGEASHYVETDPSGRRMLKRRGFQFKGTGPR